MNNESPAVAVRALTKAYGSNRAISDLTFEIGHGEVVGLLGPNGAGKSTTMRILSGLITASSGVATVCGYSVATESEKIRNIIGYMPENNPLPEDMRVEEYLLWRGRLKGLSGKRLKARVGYVMDCCDLEKKAKKKMIGSLSKGFRQRVGIADTIIAEPKVVIMDEPTIGLDPHQVRSIRRLISQLRGEMTFIISSHILPEIENICDRVIIINHGRIVASGLSRTLQEELVSELMVHLEVDCGSEVFASALSSSGLNAKLHDATVADMGYTHYVLNMGDKVLNVADIVEWAVKKNGWSLRYISLSQPTLEDVFMAATKRSWEEQRGVERAKIK